MAITGASGSVYGVRLLELMRPLPDLETLAQLSRLGAVIFAPVPSFYSRPREVGDIVDQTCMRMLDQVGLEIDVAPRWGE